MDWLTCKSRNLVIEVSKDTNLITSLKNAAEKKLRSQLLLQLTEDTATSKIILMYDALRELLEALAISNHYKIYNHECYYAFLKEVLKESTLGDRFDSFRKIRNAINYYGKEISVEEAKTLLEDMRNFIDIIKNKL